MEMILNEYSLEGQFRDTDEFVFCVNDELRMIMDYLLEKRIPLLKKCDFYERRITKDMNLAQILRITGDPLIQQIRSYISKMAFTEPYWDNDMKTDMRVYYRCPMEGDIPNCFTEAIERDKVVVSFKNENYAEEQYSYQRDGKEGNIDNITAYGKFLIWLLKQENADIKYIFEHYPFSKEICFFEMDKRCYAEEALKENGLNIHDWVSVLLNIQKLIDSLQRGEKTRFWDSIVNDIYEYRVSVSEGREFRLFFIHKEKIFFLNGFIKKQEKTPQRMINNVKKIRQMIAD